MRRSSRLRRALVVLAVALMATGVVLSAVLHRQTEALDRSVAQTGDVIEANVRTLGQAQRELLRLDLQLERDPGATEQVELFAAFVGQRLHESGLPIQLKTLGDPGLLDRAQTIAARWSMVAVPLVEAVLDDPGDARTIRELQAEIERAELEVNQLVADGEINRKVTASQARSSALDMLATTRLVFSGMIAVSCTLALTAVIAWLLFRRSDRQREESRLALEALVAETRTLSLVASGTDNMVVITDAGGHFQWVNRAFEEHTGFELSEIIGQRPGSVLQAPGTDPDTVAMMSERVRRGEAFRVEVLNRSKDGSEYWVDLAVQPVHDEAGRLTNFISIQSDVTERRRAEHRLRAMKDAAEELAREKSNFLASMSHEIRTPLNAVLGLTELLLTTELDERQREYAAIASSSGRLLLEIVDNVLDFSALEAGRVEVERSPFDIRSLVDLVARTLEPEADRRLLGLRVEIADDVPRAILGDETRLQQILVNLVSNAIKFTELGTVTIAVTAKHSETLVITVRDTGIGIAEDRLDRLFRPFSQADSSISRRFGGTGLGLAISRHLATMMDGDISIESVEGVGTVATLTLPLRHADPAAISRPSPVANRSTGSTGLRILVAEDDPVNRLVAEHMLRQLGCSADFAEDGAAAVRTVERRSYDLVLMDVQMPELDGVEATRRIRERLVADDQPMILALTASALVGDRERFLDAGMDGYLSKPIQLRDLANAIDQLGARRLGRSPVAPVTSCGDHDEAPPVRLDDLVDRAGDRAAADRLVDVLVPVLIDEATRTIAGLRAAVDEHDAQRAAELLLELDESAIGVAARPLHDAILLADAAVRAGLWERARHAVGRVDDEAARLRAWHVDRATALGAVG